MPRMKHRPMLYLQEMLLVTLERWHSRRGRKAQPNAAHQSGIRGERAAWFFLRRSGFTVVARRWRHALLDGEVDLIAWEGDTLCFVEVKTRSSRTPFAAEFSVDAAKAAALRRMAEAYVRQLPWPSGQAPRVTIRFDVASVYLAQDAPPDVRLLRDFLR